MNGLLDLVRRILFLPEPASTFALPVDGLHVFVISVTMLGTAGIAAYTLVAIARFRGPAHGVSPQVRVNAWMEAVLIAGLLSMFVLWWVLGFRTYTHMRTPPPGAMTVYVTAKQWMWKFVHPDGTSAIDTLVVPAGEPVRLVMTSRDVIHSFFVPAFRVKQDLVPGTYTEAWFQATAPGTYDLYCAEFCGVDHSRMRGRVVVLGAAAWAAWAEATAGERYASDAGGVDLAEHGRRIAVEEGCLGCHSADGVDRVGPSWLGVHGSLRRFEDHEPVVADAAYLTESMMDPLAKIVAGYPPVMPSYHGRLDAAQVAALVEYIRALGDTRGAR